MNIYGFNYYLIPKHMCDYDISTVFQTHFFLIFWQNLIWRNIPSLL